MGLKLYDSFEQAGSVSSGNAFGWLGAGNLWFSYSCGRFGTLGVRLANTGWASLDLGADYQTLIIGIAYREETSGTSDQPIFRLQDGSSDQVWLRRVGSTGQVQLVRGASTVLATASVIPNHAIYNYYELKITIDSGSGAYELRINQTNVASASGVNTQSTGNAFVNKLYLGACVSGYTANYDDLYICDTSGTRCNDFLGDCRIIADLPNADDSVQWTKSGQTFNYQCVDDPTLHNSDTDYVSSSTVDHKDLYGFPNLPVTAGIVRAVGLKIVARKIEAGDPRYLQGVCKSGASEAFTSSHLIADSYPSYFRNAPYVIESDPAGGDWSVNAVNAAKFGMILKSS